MPQRSDSHSSSSQHDSSNRRNVVAGGMGVNVGPDGQPLRSTPRSPTTLSRSAMTQSRMPILDNPITTSATISPDPRSPTTLSRSPTTLSRSPTTPSHMSILDEPSPTSTTIPSVPSTLLTTYDQERATYQTRINTLDPSEQSEQEEWAQEQLKEYFTCPSDLDWRKVEGGYVCNGVGNHYVTHELLAEGLGGLYQGKWDSSYPPSYWWYGPLYGREETQLAAEHFILPDRVAYDPLRFFPGCNMPARNCCDREGVCFDDPY